MNPFLNPVTALPFLKNFFFGSKRLYQSNPEQLERYRNNALRRIVRYAYTVPVYQKKYKKAGIRPSDITGIKDIKKLPYVTKQDIIDNYPEGVIPPSYKKENAFVVSTSGSTGKPVSLFLDFSVYSGGIGASLRSFYAHNLNWRTTRYVNLGNFTPGKADDVGYQAFFSKAKFAYSSNKYIIMNAFEPIKDIMKKLDEIRPDAMLSYPVTYQNLAYLKNKGYGKNVNPRVLFVSGYLLDEYTRAYVEEAFHCKMYNGYGAAETSSEASVAFECTSKVWHINQDFYHVETIDEDLMPMENGKIGHIVVTRLFGKATPLIRYTGLDDWVTLEDDYHCDCGLSTAIFKNGVEGRRSTSIILPDGRIFPAASFEILAVVFNTMNIRKVKQFQIVQNKIDEFEILLILDDELRNSEPTFEVLSEKIRQVYQEKVGPDVTINVREVQEIESDKNKPAPLVKSKLSETERRRIIDNST